MADSPGSGGLRSRFNLKRRMRNRGGVGFQSGLVDRVKYAGNPAHKRNPGDFCLHPPAGPLGDNTLCDDAGVFSKTEALSLLREGVRRGLVSVQTRGEFPQNVWAVTEDGYALEAQLEN